MDEVLIKTEVAPEPIIENGPKRSGAHKRRKGYKKEKLARDELVKEGWQIDFKSIRFKFGCIDYANLFDIVATMGHDKKLISVKNKAEQRTFPAHEAEILAYAQAHGLAGESFELWAWDRPRWRGRGKNKVWVTASWVKRVVWDVRTI